MCFRTQYENLNEDRSTLTVEKIWQYKVYVDIRGGFLERTASNDNAVVENVDFQCLRTLRLLFRTLGNEANIII